MVKFESEEMIDIFFDFPVSSDALGAAKANVG